MTLELSQIVEYNEIDGTSVFTIIKDREDVIGTLVMSPGDITIDIRRGVDATVKQVVTEFYHWIGAAGQVVH